MPARVPTRTLFQWAQDGALEERLAKVRAFRTEMARKERRAKRDRKPEYRAKFRDATHELLRLENEIAQRDRALRGATPPTPADTEP